MEKQLFELMTKMYSEMQEMRKELNSKLDKKADKTDIVRIEHQMAERFGALFDAREVQIDVDEKVAHNLQRVESKVDKLELRVLRNNLDIPTSNEC